MDLVVLQERFGIGYREAWHVRPAWEIDNLLDYVRSERVHADKAAAKEQMMSEHAAKMERLKVG